MLLPHELIAALAKHNSLESLLVRDGLTKDCREHLQQAEGKLQKASLLGLGLWCDGVPYNWDRSQSIEVVSLSLPGLCSSGAQLRLPLFGINKKYLLTNATYDDLFTVLSWSFRCLAVGHHPAARHDGAAWHKSDAKRRRAAGSAIGAAGVLLEIRGDWAMMKQVFRFPSWNQTAGICWLCRCTPVGVRDCSSTASWRTQRLSHCEFLAEQARSGRSISPLFSSPCLTAKCFKPDWLHAVDQGCAADFLGSLLWVLLRLFPGATLKLRCGALFRDIKGFYAEHKTESRYDNLTVKMFKTKQGYKLRGKAAEVRGLIPWAKQACERFLRDDNEEHSTIKNACFALAACYEQLSREVFDVNVMASQSKRFCLLLVALEDSSPIKKLWHVKPKLHMMQELCEMAGENPAKYWCYRDEDFGGSLAAFARHRGGSNSFAVSGTKMLTRFMAKHKVPVLN